MAGVKGKSGGIRVGAGRKPKSKPQKRAEAKRPPKDAPPAIEGRDMLQFLQDVALGRIESTTLQVRAAIAAVQYTHTKRGDGGKKDGDAEKAKKAGSGKFSAPAAPKLVVSNK